MDLVPAKLFVRYPVFGVSMVANGFFMCAAKPPKDFSFSRSVIELSRLVDTVGACFVELAIEACALRLKQSHRLVLRSLGSLVFLRPCTQYEWFLGASR